MCATCYEPDVEFVDAKTTYRVEHSRDEIPSDDYEQMLAAARAAES